MVTSKRPILITVVGWYQIIIGALGVSGEAGRWVVALSRYGMRVADGPRLLALSWFLSLFSAYLISGVAALRAARWGRGLFLVFALLSVAVRFLVPGHLLAPGGLYVTAIEFHLLVAALLFSPTASEYYVAKGSPTSPASEDPGGVCAGRAPDRRFWLRLLLLPAVMFLVLIYGCVEAGEDVSYTVGYLLFPGLLAGIAYYKVILRRRSAVLAILLPFLTCGVCLTGGILKLRDPIYQQQQMAAALRRGVEDLSVAFREGDFERARRSMDRPVTGQSEAAEMERCFRRAGSRGIELAQNCQKELDAAGWDGLLDLPRLKADKDMSESRRIVAKTEGIMDRYELLQKKSVSDLVRDIRGLRINRRVKEGMLERVDEVAASATAEIERHYDLERRVVAQNSRIIDFLSARRGKWQVQNGQMLFRSARDVEAYNSLIRGLSELEEQEDEERKKRMERLDRSLENLEEITQ